MSSPNSTARKSRRYFVSTYIVASAHPWLCGREKSTPGSGGLSPNSRERDFLSLVVNRRVASSNTVCGAKRNSTTSFSALPVDAPECTGAKMANTCRKILSQQGAYRRPTRPKWRARALSRGTSHPLRRAVRFWLTEPRISLLAGSSKTVDRDAGEQMLSGYSIRRFKTPALGCEMRARNGLPYDCVLRESEGGVRKTPMTNYPHMASSHKRTDLLSCLGLGGVFCTEDTASLLFGSQRGQFATYGAVGDAVRCVP